MESVKSLGQLLFTECCDFPSLMNVSSLRANVHTEDAELTAECLGQMSPLSCFLSVRQNYIIIEDVKFLQP